MKKKIGIGLLCFIGFILVTILVLTNNIVSFDNSVYQLVYGHHNQYLDFFFTHFTHIGDTIPVMVITTILLWIFQKWEDKIVILGSLVSTVVVNQALKNLIARPRPPLERRLIKQGGYSFPSGHSMISLCVYGVLIYFVVTKIQNKLLKTFLIILLTMIILLIGISRIYVGVHYPSDVLGGYLLTIVIIITSISVITYHFKGE